MRPTNKLCLQTLSGTRISFLYSKQGDCRRYCTGRLRGLLRPFKRPEQKLKERKDEAGSAFKRIQNNAWQTTRALLFEMIYIWNVFNAALLYIVASGMGYYILTERKKLTPCSLLRLRIAAASTFYRHNEILIGFRLPLYIDYF